jgi:hypothetical protein
MPFGFRPISVTLVDNELDRALAHQKPGSMLAIPMLISYVPIRTI